MKRIKDNFHFIIIGAFFLFAFCILILGGADRIVLSKNGVLDMFIPQYQALKNQGIQEDSVIEISVTDPSGKKIETNIKVKQSDLDLFNSLKNMR